MKCNHEEADTRIIFHLTNSLNKNRTVVIKSDDTDVLVLLLYYYWNNEIMKTCEIFMETGHIVNNVNKKKYIPVHQIAENLGKPVSDSLPAFHCLTGCDTTSSFYKIGKKSGFQILLKSCNNIDLPAFGKCEIDDSVSIARKFVSKLYKQERCDNLNEIRRTLTQTTKKSAQEIPPTEDAFYFHVLR